MDGDSGDDDECDDEDSRGLGLRGDLEVNEQEEEEGVVERAEREEVLVMLLLALALALDLVPANLDDRWSKDGIMMDRKRERRRDVEMEREAEVIDRSIRLVREKGEVEVESDCSDC